MIKKEKKTVEHLGNLSFPFPRLSLSQAMFHPLPRLCSPCFHYPLHTVPPSSSGKPAGSSGHLFLCMVTHGHGLSEVPPPAHSTPHKRKISSCVPAMSPHVCPLPPLSYLPPLCLLLLCFLPVSLAMPECLRLWANWLGKQMAPAPGHLPCNHG